MSSNKIFIPALSETEKEELRKMSSKKVTDLTPRELEAVILFFIKRNNKSKPNPRALFESVVGDLCQQLDSQGDESGLKKLAGGLNQLIKKGQVTVLFEVDFDSYFGQDLPFVECILKIAD